MNSAAIVLAAGRSRRMGGNENKVLQLLNERPVLSYSLEAFQQHASVNTVVVVCRDEEREQIEPVIDEYCPKAKGHFVTGGQERFDSVRNGLESLVDDNPEAVFIHDSARPFLRQAFITDSLECLKTYKGCVVGIPLFDTLKEIIADSNDHVINQTHPRSKFWLAQTPQTFRYPDILNAYRSLNPPPLPTDDGEVLELAGETVVMVQGSRTNMKLTTPEDWLMAKAIIQMQ
jgi:2-C-methyl-D-erythritol 4-phosphate cytidylyltransferase